MKPCRYCAEEIQDAAVLCRFCNREQSAPPEPAERHAVLNAVVALVVVLVVGAGGFLLGNSTMDANAASRVANANLAAGEDSIVVTRSEPKRLPPAPPPPSRFTMMDPREVALDAGQYMVHTFDLRDWGPCSVRGYVGVTGGGSHDVDLFFVDEAGFSRYKQGSQFRAIFARGRTRGENLDLTLTSPGMYYLIVSNRFSWITGKSVQFGTMTAECTAPMQPDVSTSPP